MTEQQPIAVDIKDVPYHKQVIELKKAVSIEDFMLWEKEHLARFARDANSQAEYQQNLIADLEAQLESLYLYHEGSGIQMEDMKAQLKAATTWNDVREGQEPSFKDIIDGIICADVDFEKIEKPFGFDGEDFQIHADPHQDYRVEYVDFPYWRSINKGEV